jgi:hypothetical protein
MPPARRGGVVAAELADQVAEHEHADRRRAAERAEAHSPHGEVKAVVSADPAITPSER